VTSAGVQPVSALQARHRLLEEREAVRVVEVADVLRQDRLLAARQADGRLQLTADREHARARHREGQPQRVGTKPRARRIMRARPAITRTTESSARA
jgi:hypothetical protein